MYPYTRRLPESTTEDLQAESNGKSRGINNIPSNRGYIPKRKHTKNGQSKTYNESSDVGNYYNNSGSNKLLHVGERRSLSSSPTRLAKSVYTTRVDHQTLQPEGGAHLSRSHRHNTRRSKSTSNDLIFVERKNRYANHSHSHKYVPSDFEYKGKLKVKCGKKKINVPYTVAPIEHTHAVPHHFTVCEEVAPPIHHYNHNFIQNVEAPCLPPVTNYLPYHSGFDMSTSQPMDMSTLSTRNLVEYPKKIPPSYTAGTSGLYDMYYQGKYQSSYPPIPPGSKIIAQYVRDLDEVYPKPYPTHSIQSTANNYQPVFEKAAHTPQSYPVQCGTTDTFVKKCVPKSKIIEVWRRQKSNSKGQFSLESIKQDIVDSITNEIKKMDFGDRYHHVIESSSKPVERDVKVVVQPIQPIFYLPKQQPVQQTITQVPVEPPRIAQPPAPPSVVYVPRNVYVPVIKPVFVPRERVIVRPQIVQVARPVVIDRPIPVAQRPIVIDREKPVPFPVIRQTPQDMAPIYNEQYIYRDNLPLAYGGRTGEFATGMNYGYVPVNENYQYIVSGCDDLLRQRLVNKHHTHTHDYLDQQYANQHYDSSGYLSSSGGAGDCFDEALSDMNVIGGHRTDSIPNVYGSHPIVHQAQHIPIEILDNNNYIGSRGDEYTTSINIGKENRTALVETLRRAGTGCVNLEVLDPTIKPVWEPVDAKMLIQRYGQSAVRFVESSGINYGYSPYSRSSHPLMNDSQQLANVTASKPKYSNQQRAHSMDFNRSNLGGSGKLSGYSVSNVGNFSLAANQNFNNPSTSSNQRYDNEIVNDFAFAEKSSNVHNQQHSSSSLQIGGIDQWASPTQYQHSGMTTGGDILDGSRRVPQ